jgi:hypothetical protein
VKGRALTVRAIALFGAASAAVHQLRYAIAYGDAAPQALAAHNHAYMSLALPAVATVFVVALSALLVRVARGRTTAQRRRMPLATLWLCCALAIGTIYGVQETLEGAGGLAGGGWIGFALAFPAGLLVALAVRGSDAASIDLGTVLVRVEVIAAAPTATPPPSPPRRLLDLRLGARAPPAAFVM